MLTLSLYDHDTGCWGTLSHNQQILRLEFNHSSHAACRLALIKPHPSLQRELQNNLLLKPLGSSLDFTHLAELAPSTGNSKFAQVINHFLSGKSVSLLNVKLYEYCSWSALKTRVMQLTRNIPYGETITYSELATAAGAPGAARAIGSIMASNPYPLVVPCHRVLGSGGRLGGYSAPGGLDTKQRLLLLEHVSLKKYSRC